MPLSQYLPNKSIEPNQLERLSAAYTLALRSLHLVDRNDPIARIVAQKIVDIGLSSAGTPRDISDRVIRDLIRS